MIYCTNCDTEAVKQYTFLDGVKVTGRYGFCFTCAEAFEHGFALCADGESYETEEEEETEDEAEEVEP